jgi:hypothetical protein
MDELVIYCRTADLDKPITPCLLAEYNGLQL